MTVPAEKAPANYVPAAAVIHRVQALSGFIGRKELVGGTVGQKLKRRAQPCVAFETAELEYGRGRRNSTCSGEMRRYVEEHQWRRQSSGPLLTLRSESVGSEQD
jgi:hypothetical protein